jgi:hypothetical protein
VNYDEHLRAMDIKQIIIEVDKEIALLKQIRGLLAGTNINLAPPKRRTLSAEARKRIADAQRKRWAKAKRQPNKPPTGG